MNTDDGGALIEYVSEHVYFVVLMLDGAEVCRRGPYRDGEIWHYASRYLPKEFRPMGRQIRRITGRQKPIKPDGWRHGWRPK